MKPIEGGVTAPKGFQASGVSAGLKRSGKKDASLVFSTEPASVAGMFTKNLMKSPPVHWNVDVCRGGKARCVFTNSGNANAATGDKGKEDVRTTAQWLADSLGISPEEVCICSTGVIGVLLPMDKIKNGVELTSSALSENGHTDAATAIMTTDTFVKEFAVEVQLSGGTVRIGAMAKGSGMINPNMATMIAVITTDGAIGPKDLDAFLRPAVDRSFHCICVDNDMSTSDTVLVLANGASGIAVTPDSTDGALFAEALEALCLQIAHSLVKDGEGATKFVEIQVEGASSEDDAKTVARTIAYSQLCKTAFYGQDPNWGRLACAAGYSGAQFLPEDLAIWLDGVQIVSGGMGADYQEKDAAAVMKQPAFVVRVSIGSGPGRARFWTSDLSQGYVSINADYRS